MTRQVDFVFLYVSMCQQIVWLIIRAVRSLHLNVVNMPGFRVVILDYSPYEIYYIAPALGRIFKVVQYILDDDSWVLEHGAFSP